MWILEGADADLRRKVLFPVALIAEVYSTLDFFVMTAQEFLQLQKN